MKHIQATKIIVFAALLGLLLASGCTSVTLRGYAPFVRDLDGRSELCISTYPAGFPTKVGRKRAGYESYETNEDLYFQVFIRDIKKRAGPNPHIESVCIHSFTCRIGDAPPELLLSGYTKNFWMQGNPQAGKRVVPPIPYHAKGRVSIEMDLTLNGKRYSFKGDMPARESRIVAPTFIKNQTL